MRNPEYIYLVESDQYETLHYSLLFDYCHPVDFLVFEKCIMSDVLFLSAPMLIECIFEHDSYDGEYRLCYQNWFVHDSLESHLVLLDKMLHFVGHMQLVKTLTYHLKSFYLVEMLRNMLNKDTMNVAYFCDYLILLRFPGQFLNHWIVGLRKCRRDQRPSWGDGTCFWLYWTHWHIKHLWFHSSAIHHPVCWLTMRICRKLFDFFSPLNKGISPINLWISQ